MTDGESITIMYKYINKQAAADIIGPLQIWPMKYILYIGINLAIIIKQYGDRKNSSGF